MSLLGWDECKRESVWWRPNLSDQASSTAAPQSELAFLREYYRNCWLTPVVHNLGYMLESTAFIPLHQNLWARTQATIVSKTLRWFQCVVQLDNHTLNSENHRSRRLSGVCVTKGTFPLPHAGDTPHISFPAHRYGPSFSHTCGNRSSRLPAPNPSHAFLLAIRTQLCSGRPLSLSHRTQGKVTLYPPKVNPDLS